MAEARENGRRRNMAQYCIYLLFVVCIWDNYMENSMQIQWDSLFLCWMNEDSFGVTVCVARESFNIFKSSLEVLLADHNHLSFIQFFYVALK